MASQRRPPIHNRSQASEPQRGPRGSNARMRKSLGQNFLVDEDVLRLIVETCEISSKDVIVEVGAGQGVVTGELAARAGRVIAVELDQELAAGLRLRFSTASNVEIVSGDILDFNPQRSLEGQPYKVVGNLPYYITGLTLRHFLTTAHKPGRMVVMVQKEVGERMVAEPGRMSVLSASVQLYGQPKLVAIVPPGAFHPRPKVHSALVAIQVFERPAFPADTEPFFRVVHAGFAHSRKQLHNALPRTIWLPPGEASSVLREVGIEESARAQTLSLGDWWRLTLALQSRGFL